MKNEAIKFGISLGIYVVVYVIVRSLIRMVQNKDAPNNIINIVL